MTQEDKELLLKDLCSRLPYKVKCRYSGEIPMIGEVTNNIGVLSNIHVDKDCPFEINGGIYGFADAKPYLRSMSSMTDEELIKFLELRGMNLNSEELQTLRKIRTPIVSSLSSYSRHIDWLNKNMFDYRVLIDKGLALEAPEGMYE